MEFHCLSNEKAEPGQPLAPPDTPSAENMRISLARATSVGTVGWTDHFRKRCLERSFTTMDAEELIETGTLIYGPVYNPTFENWKCELSGTIDGRTWLLVLAIDARSDLVKSPHVILISVHRVTKKQIARRKAKE